MTNRLRIYKSCNKIGEPMFLTIVSLTHRKTRTHRGLLERLAFLRRRFGGFAIVLRCAAAAALLVSSVVSALSAADDTEPGPRDSVLFEHFSKKKIITIANESTHRSSPARS